MGRGGGEMLKILPRGQTNLSCPSAVHLRFDAHVIKPSPGGAICVSSARQAGGSPEGLIRPGDHSLVTTPSPPHPPHHPTLPPRTLLPKDGAPIHEIVHEVQLLSTLSHHYSIVITILFSSLFYCHHFVKAKTKDRERKKEKQRCRCPLRLVTLQSRPGYTAVSAWLHSSLSLVTHQSQPGYTPVSAWLHSSLSLVTLQT